MTFRHGIAAGHCQEHINSRLCKQDNGITNDLVINRSLLTYWVIQCSNHALMITNWTSFWQLAHSALQQSLPSLVEHHQSLLWLDNALQNNNRRYHVTSSMAAPVNSVGKPSAERSPFNITSFQKKTRSKLISIPGTRPSVQNGQLLVSTGVTSLDYLLGQSNVSASNKAKGVFQRNVSSTHWS